MVEVRIQSLGLDPESKVPMVILQERQGERILPIWIGPGEASAIAVQLAEMSFERPLTHDLLASILQGLGGDLSEVHITRVENGTYYAELHLERNGGRVSIDARPSDSIALALRVEAPILVDESLLEWASVEVVEGGQFDEGGGGVAGEESPSLPRPMNAEELKAYLQTLDPEDFGRFTP